MKQTLTFAAALLCCCALLLGCSSVVAKSVVVGFDSNFADTSPWDSADPTNTGEAVNVVRWLWSLSENVMKITDYTDDTAWLTAVSKGKVIIFIENEENGDDEIVAALSEETRSTLTGWVRNNGTIVVFCNGELEPAQTLTGLNLVDRKRGAPIRSGDQRSVAERGVSPIGKTSDGADSALFASAPNTIYDINACNPWYLGNELPAKSDTLKCMYGSNSACYLWRYADGEGAWYGVGPDFYNWGYEGGQDGGWEAVMKIVINHSSAAQLSHWIQWLAALLL